MERTTAFSCLSLERPNRVGSNLPRRENTQWEIASRYIQLGLSFPNFYLSRELWEGRGSPGCQKASLPRTRRSGRVIIAGPALCLGLAQAAQPRAQTGPAVDPRPHPYLRLLPPPSSRAPEGGGGDTVQPPSRPTRAGFNESWQIRGVSQKFSSTLIQF